MEYTFYEYVRYLGKWSLCKIIWALSKEKENLAFLFQYYFLNQKDRKKSLLLHK